MLQAAIWIVGLIWSAAVAWTTVRLTQKQTTKQLNGVGNIAREAKKRGDSQYLALCLAIMLLAPEKDRAALAAMLKPGMD